MQIHIEKEISAEVFMLMMEIGKATERKDIVSVVKLAAEHGGALSPEILCRELLNDRPENVGRTVLNRCCSERLMEWTEDGEFTNLTRDGEVTAETGVHYQAMRDIYEIVYYDKGLVPCLIDCKGTGQNEFNRDKQKSSFKPYDVNNVVKNKLTEETSFILPGKNDSIKVFSVETKGARSDNQRKLKISYTLNDDGKNELQLSGEIKGQFTNPDYSFAEGFKSILKSIGQLKNWDSRNKYLKVSFSDLTSDFERRNFTLNILEKKIVNDYFCQDSLDVVRVTGVPVFPRALEDAREWFMWLLKNEIKDYLEEDQYQEYSDKIREKFGRFADDLEIPSSGDLANIIKQDTSGKIPDTYWYLVVPIDLRRIGSASRKHVACEDDQNKTVVW